MYIFTTSSTEVITIKSDIFDRITLTLSLSCREVVVVRCACLKARRTLATGGNSLTNFWGSF